MRILGMILIVAGVLMLIFSNVSFTKEEKLVDVGPLEINKKEKETIAWPSYAGGLAILAGIALVVLDKRKV